MQPPAVGVMFQHHVPPELIPSRARLIEDLGFNELWMIEDLTWAGGISQAATALAVTERIRVGIGILPAAARNVAFAAMELGTLERLHPGRLLVGIGHGVPEWIASVGASVASPLSLLEEHLVALRRLLAGETVTLEGRYVQLDNIRLEFPGGLAPPVFAGVRGPRSIDMAARAADGVLLAEPASPAYVRATRDRLDAAAPSPTRTTALACYSWAAVDSDAAAARRRVLPVLTAMPGGLADPSVRAHLEALSFADELLGLIESRPSREALSSGLKDEWIDELAVVGSPERCKTAILARKAAGADHVVLVPPVDHVEDEIRRLGTLVLPLLRET